MLELKRIKKDYPAGDGTVHALKGIDLQFRESEFVSILGPSGCGKTTMLNIIGGLDQYSEGDLVINGRSTKDFKDRDWDAYRNHSIGFVFQSYNLIPHQSVLQNVELALTLSGVSKSERRRRAKKALEDVGLGNQLKKRPSEMSGGQMQRVAIARALVNNPDIILADEPTGALDTETSVQVMEILKEISKDRLIIMVTHNPELAARYSSRIIRMLDGEITDDSAPLTQQEREQGRRVAEEKAANSRKQKKPSMSFATSFGLSLKNLFTKKGRTALTSFAGSIGIIGIALIFAVSQGMTTYINMVQEDTLASYPLTIEAQHVDMGTLMRTFMGSMSEEHSHEADGVYSQPVVYDMINSLNNLETTENDLKSFRAYIEQEKKKENSASGLQHALSGVQYTYDFDLTIYTENVDGRVIESDTQEMLQEMIREFMGMDMSAMMEMSESSSTSPLMSMMTGGGMAGAVRLWQEMLPGKNGEPVSPLLEKQYDVVYGSWPTAYNEVVLVLDENNELDDMTLYALGLKPKEDIDAIMDAAINQTELEVKEDSWSYEEICDLEFRAVLGSDCYTKDEVTGLYTDLRTTEAGMRYLYDHGLSLKVTGVVRPNPEASSTMLTGSIAYTHELTEYVAKQVQGAEVVSEQLANPEIDIFNGLPFKEAAGELENATKEEDFRAYVAEADESKQAEIYTRMMCIPSQEELDSMLAQAMAQTSQETLKASIVQGLTEQMGMQQDEVQTYIDEMEEEDLNLLITQMMTEQIKAQYAGQVSQQLAGMTTQQLAMALQQSLDQYTPEQFGVFYDEIMEFSESTYEDNLRDLGYVDLASPSTMNLYAASFESKDKIEDAIAAYNTGVEELSQIRYTDYVGIMMSSVTSIINAITYVLISFVAISLIVSSIMIGVITLISVQERTKEIGILRAIGASKRNVSSMFNAETVIIGFTSGLLGILITYLLCIPINMVIQHLTGIEGLSAYLPWPVAVVLILISMGLTLISGIIPSRSAAKKDPVVALRSE